MNKKCLNCEKELSGKQKKCCSIKCYNTYYNKNNKNKVKKWKKKYYQKNKEAYSEYALNRYQNNKEKIKEKNKQYYQNNEEKIKESNKRYCQENKEKRRQTVAKYYQNNKEKIEEYRKEYYQDNKEKIKNYYQNIKTRIRIKKYIDNKYKNDCIFRLNLNLSTCIRASLKSNNLSKNGRHWKDLVGYTVYELKEHLENLFQTGMTWDNHGKWHIDHIIPKHFFKYKSIKDVEFKYCWSLNNLQPMWAEKNMKKNGKIPWKNNYK